MDPNELIHLAYQEEIEVELATDPFTLHLLEKDYCLSILPTKIPIFAALALKKGNMCQIRQPEYLSVDYLERVLKEETENEEYGSIYTYIFEVGTTLIDHCYNMDDAERSRVLLKAIKETRFNKTHLGLKHIEGKALNLNNLTPYEFNEIKEYLIGGMVMSREIAPPEKIKP
ncbi:putative DNA replication complex GINS protein PSF2 [Astathelohania contejeani]|uniref:DNA replication complex GINS protein PSF2 n=1 Tax=Astathelohania contejeani TaxID=164912 RepID=A0ABQ7HVM0_9MICR|nr:putative DNA replication complex GINS protein PSF2 [Thelohania contejeani]